MSRLRRSHSCGDVGNYQYLLFLSAGVFIISSGLNIVRESRSRSSSSASLWSSRKFTLLWPVTMTIPAFFKARQKYQRRIVVTMFLIVFSPTGLV